RLTERIIRVARARPMAERSSRREARLARMNVAAVLGGEPTQVQHFDRSARLCQNLARNLEQAIGLRHFAGTGVLAARRTVDQQKCRPRLICVATRGVADTLARVDPVDR